MDDFESFLWRLSKNLFAAAAASQQQSQAEPYFEVSESDEGVMITAELPLVNPQDLRVNVTEREVTVTVEANGGESFSESFETEGIDPKDARITFKNGILQMRLPYRKSVF